MICPSEEDFYSLARDFNCNVVPVYKEILADLETPISIYQKVCGKNEGFLLESGNGGERGRYSFIGFDPFLIFSCKQDKVTLWRPAGKESLSGSPFDILKKLMDSFRPAKVEGLPYFWGGAVGYFGYSLARFIENIKDWPEEDLNLPDCILYFPKLVLIYDHRLHKLKVVYNAIADSSPSVQNLSKLYTEARLAIENTVALLNKKFTFPAKPAKNVTDNGYHINSSFSEVEFKKAVAEAKKLIFEGEIFQVVLSQRLETELKVSPFAAYRTLRSLNPSPYQFYLNYGLLHLIGASPEMLARLEGRVATTRPIAGTRPRGKTSEEDARLAAELLADEKEKAEHIMLVDLGRNDLGKVCEFGSVKVEKLLQVEYFSHVIHLVSEVTGVLRKGLDALDLLKATFPAGTVSGAPKVRAMEIINELEPCGRGPYAGAVGYIGFNGNMDTCITIRTLLVNRGKISVQAGAGIVADSDPEREYLETMCKAAAPLRALALAGGGDRGAVTY